MEVSLIKRTINMWNFKGQQRPSFAIVPGEGQESVWDYPRPPALVEDERKVVIRLGDLEIARSLNAVRVLETASPPTVYIPSSDISMQYLKRSPNQSFCEWKGAASYWSLVSTGSEEGRDVNVRDCGWSYESPTSRFARLQDHFSFYPGRLECWLGGEQVQPQPGGFYGGWVTSEIVGPWKGEHGTGGW